MLFVPPALISSLPRILAFGLVAVTLPLLISLFIVSSRLSNFAEYSRQSTAQAVALTRGLQELSLLTREMERSTRQYEVMRSDDFFDRVTRHHEAFRLVILRLAELTLVAPIKSHFDELADTEEEVMAQFGHARGGSAGIATVIDGFTRVNKALTECRVESVRLIDQRNTYLSEEAASLRQWVVIVVVLTVLVVVVTTVWFSRLLNRHARRLSDAVQQLGLGDYDDPVTLKGPREIVAIGAELEWLRQRLQALEGQQTTFLTHVSHELKTPLSAMREGTALLSDGVTGALSDDQYRVVAILEDNVSRLQQGIHDLVETQRLANEKLTLRPENFALNEVVDEVIKDHFLVMETKNLTVVREFVDAPFFGDREKIKIVAGNLVDNAIRYSPVGGSVRVILSSCEQGFEVDVIDQGPGISTQNKETVFEPFHQTTVQPTDCITGSGLGLSIARSYARIHGGDVVVCDSPRGAHLQLKLPVDARDGSEFH